MHVDREKIGGNRFLQILLPRGAAIDSEAKLELFMPSSILHKIFTISIGRPSIVAVISIVISVVVALVIVQKFFDRNEMQILEGHAIRILARAVDIADQSDAVLQKAQRLSTAPCSEADIDQLRILSFESRFVRDVVRIEDGTIVCSAAWAQLKDPLVLPIPNHQVGPYRIWRLIQSSPIGGLLADVTARGAVASVTAPGAFDGIDFAEPEIDTLVVSGDGEHVFRSMGDVGGLLKAFRNHSLDDDPNYIVSKCHETWPFCVVEASPRVPIWSSPSRFLAALIILSVFAGMGIGFLINGYLDRRNSLASQLRRAIAKDAIAVVYQPIRMLGDRSLVGVEALARWRDRAGNNVPPDKFVPLAEKMGLLDALTRSVLRTTFLHLGDRLRADPHFYASVNVAPEELINPDFREFLQQLRAEYGISAERVALEVTERSTSDFADLAASFKKMRDLGHNVMIDDFGTGYSNFAYLAELPLDAIKMDRAFTNAIGTESLASEVIPGIAAIARAMNVVLIVEGIETEEQAVFLTELHPNARGQGWHFGRPVPATDLPAA